MPKLFEIDNQVFLVMHRRLRAINDIVASNWDFSP